MKVQVSLVHNVVFSFFVEASDDIQTFLVIRITESVSLFYSGFQLKGRIGRI